LYAMRMFVKRRNWSRMKLTGRGGVKIMMRQSEVAIRDVKRSRSSRKP
uniref:50S ribosomal protein L34 n=1 Tax=Anisakis simplex TaxID=6269 RepID=A0A0M3JDS5_ANISI